MKKRRESPAVGLRSRLGWGLGVGVGVGVIVSLVPLAACSGSGGDSSVTRPSATGPAATLPWTAPTKAEVADAAGLELPGSVTAWRSVLMSPGELDVAFTISPDDVAGFDEASGLGLEADARVVTHASPLWELNVEGTYAGSSTAHGKVRRAVEVVTPTDDAAPAQVRMVLTAIP